MFYQILGSVFEKQRGAKRDREPLLCEYVEPSDLEYKNQYRVDVYIASSPDHGEVGKGSVRA